DDIAENILALEALLRRDGLVIDTASTAAQALALMLQHEYALAFLDVPMPETDGYELAELMRGTARTRDVPIIFVTAATMDDARRFRGYEAGAVDYIFKPIDPRILKSKADVFFRIGCQARELARQRDQLQEIARLRDRAIARLRAHADNSPLALVECDSNLVIRAWSDGAERLFGFAAADMLGQNITTFNWISPEAADRMAAWFDCGTDTPPRFAIEIDARDKDSQRVWCEFYGSILCDDGDVYSLSLQIHDITERRRAEEVRSLLIGELNHRIKNTLANVQSIARQSLRQAKDLASFDTAFAGRLQALARAHSILSDVTWARAPLDDLIDDQIRAGTLDAERLHRAGPPVLLAPDMMLRLALTLHELGTNAQKYGALSVPEGQVHLNWSFADGCLSLTWRESGGPPVIPPSREGFGSALIAAAGGGDMQSVTADWHPDGVVWSLRLGEGVSSCDQKQLTAEPPVAQAEQIPDGLNGCHILLVEDEPLVAMDMRHELEDAGADSVTVARTVAEAIDMATKRRFDIAVLDGNLGGEPVDEVAHTLTSRSVPFCFVSGYGREHLPHGYDRAPLIEKPFRSEALRATLASIRQGAA
ncbi:MAG: response regulator, partial [Paracoccus sp. (in: a-proteobacteria)]|nr:response regulator [Paracoccus sp. (in: a-proteobacteria)]